VVIERLLNSHLISLGRDDDLFRTTYPAADRSIKALLTAIRVQHNERRRSKYGTPEERDGSQEQEGMLSEPDT